MKKDPDPNSTDPAEIEALIGLPFAKRFTLSLTKLSAVISPSSGAL
jgi:hypothetical protein